MKPGRQFFILFGGLVLLTIILGVLAPRQSTPIDVAADAPTTAAEPVNIPVHGATTRPNPTTQPTPEPSPTPVPTPPPPPTREQLKAQFLQDVDESISGSRIAGNPYKFVGDKVDLHGTVANVLDDSSFNFTTGDIESGDYAIILITTNPGEASNLEANQSLRIVGTVEQPTAGTNAMGGSMDFPTVHAEFME